MKNFVMPNSAHAGCDCEPEAPVDPWRKGFTRRRVLQGSAALVAAVSAQTVTAQYSFATAGDDTDTLVMVHLRGGWDSLSVIVPAFESEYYRLRPGIAIPADRLLPLDRNFGFHPKLPKLHEIYKAGMLAPVVGAGTPDESFSHFIAQDTLERGFVGGNNKSGWINRLLELRGDADPLAGTQFGPQAPLAFIGRIKTAILPGIDGYGLYGYDRQTAQAGTVLGKMFAGVQHPIADQAQTTLGLIKTIDEIRNAPSTTNPEANYPGAGFPRHMRDIARLIKAKKGLKVAAVDLGGWDMHSGLGAPEDSMSNFLAYLDDTLGAFVKDLGDEINNVTIMVISEFGRTVAENGSNGTDHGHGQSIMVIGGGVNGNRVHGEWPTLAQEKLVANGSLTRTSDYRDVLSEILQKRGAVGSTTKIFPDFRPNPLGITRARG